MSLSIQGIKSIFQRPDLGLLVMRLSLGVVLVIAGWNKFSAGQDVLKAVGSNIRYIGLEVGSQDVFALFFGIMAAGSEVVCGALLILGLLFRTSTAILGFTMLVATVYKYQASSGDLTQFGYPMVVMLMLIGLLFTGPGKLALQKD